MVAIPVVTLVSEIVSSAALNNCAEKIELAASAPTDTSTTTYVLSPITQAVEPSPVESIV